MGRWLLLCLLLIGCSEPPAPKRAHSALSTDASSRTFHFRAGDLTVLEVPVQEGRWVETRRCFLWESGERQSLHCPSEYDPPVAMTPSPETASAAERY